MNRNVESHFSQLPKADIQRSTFDRSATYKTSFNTGRLIPFYLDEVLPGDTFDITTAKVVRSQTMLTPIMDNIYLDTYYFFVPNRLVWEHWREFCGENTTSAWAPTVEYPMPVITPPDGGFATGTIADYFGLPVGVEWTATDDMAPMALPFRAYALICNEFFRDQNLSDPLLIPTDDSNQAGTNGDSYISDVANGGMPFKVARYHDYFSSALPAPQKGNPVSIPVSIPAYTPGTLPVYAGEFNPSLFGSKIEDAELGANSFSFKKSYPFMFYSLKSVSGETYNAEMPLWPDGALTGSGSGDDVPDDPTIGSGNLQDFGVMTTTNLGSNPNTLKTLSGIRSGASMSTSNLPFAPANLYTDVPSWTPAELDFTVNEMRLAFAYQRYLETMARGGSRYIEILLSLFGVQSPDARLQRPEYLGGNRIPINVNEITNNAQTEQDFLGDLGAMSQTSDVHSDFIKSFTEHGFIVGVMCARYDHSYSQGIERFWTRKEFTDYYNPKFANLGEVPVYSGEIYAPGNMSKSNVFGYQEIWADYRYKPNKVTGEMRPQVNNSLAHWHLSDYYSKTPILSDAWIREDPAIVDRVLAVQSTVSNQFWCDIYIRNRCTRCMPMYSIPGLIDHF